MWYFFSTWRPLENRVFKTRFINQKNLKKLGSLKRSLTSPNQIKLEREKESDQREGDQIKERERVRSDHGLGRAA